ncbi:acyltransferase family protein [Bacillus sp. JJ1521]|uniref:acyltransferase family protein n=1 Tax=Bacillus sp. JJ1521 TaxID=3122957 RepID=UPI003F689C66
MENKYNHNMDTLKFICAIFVVAIHTTFYIYQNNMATVYNYYFYRPTLEIAVPFFFAASGYFISLKIREGNKNYILRYSKNIFKIYVSFSVFYIFFQYLLLISDRLYLNKPFWERVVSLTQSPSIKDFINGSIGSFHLWYLTSLILACLFLHLFIKFSISPNIIFLISFLFYLAFISELTLLHNIYKHGGVGKAFFFLSLGYYLGNKKVIINHPILLFIFFISIFSVLYKMNSQIQIIFLILATFSLMVFCVNNPGKQTLLSKLGKHSLKIYILHIFILEIINKFYIYNGYPYYAFKSYYFISTFLCIVLSIVLYKPIENFFVKNINKTLNKIID